MAKKYEQGFTVVELLIVITIMLVLASSAIAGGMYILRMLKFNNVFNKVILMVQNARSMAATEKGGGETAKYGVRFFSGTPFYVQIFSQSAADATDGTITEAFYLPRDFSMQIQDLTITIGSSTCESTVPTTPLAEIIFPKASRDIVMKCEGTDVSSGPDPPEKIKLMQFSISSVGPFGTTTKAFVVHKTTGMPQIR